MNDLQPRNHLDTKIDAARQLISAATEPMDGAKPHIPVLAAGRRSCSTN